MDQRGLKKGLSLGVQVTLVTGCIIAVLLAVILAVTGIRAEKMLEDTLDQGGLGFVESLQVGVAQEIGVLKVNNTAFVDGVTQGMKGQRFFDSEDTVELGKKQIKKLFFMDNGLQQITNGQKIVSEWKKAIGAEFSMFQIVDEGLIRVATTMKNSDGNFMLGEIFAKDSPQYINTVKKGVSYEDVVFFNGKAYEANYTPIKDAEGNIRVVVFAGSSLESVIDRILNSHIGKGSYGWLFNDDGKVVAHPEFEIGSSVSEISKVLWNACNERGVFKNDSPMEVSYTRDGGNFSGYVQKVAGTDWHVMIIVDNDLAMKPIGHLKKSLLIWGLPLSLIGLLLLAWAVLKLIAPLKNVVSIADHIANGDLSMEISGNDNSRNEVHKVMAAFSRILSSYKGLVSKIVEMNGQFAQGSLKMANISDDVKVSLDSVNTSAKSMSEMIDSIASAAEETNAGVEEVSSGVASSTNVITGLSEKSQVMTSNAEDGMTAVDGVTDGATRVEEASSRVMDAIANLESSVEGIVGFVNTIAQIADQTNLLALNAAIEAARAGDAGRGFAVVAEEVRKLAEESNRAAGNIGKVIEEVQSSMTVAGDDSRKAGVLIDELSSRSVEAAGKIREITDGINAMAEGIQSIAAASEEQSASTQEIAQAVDNIASMLNDGRESALAMGETASVMEDRMNDLVEIRETQQSGLRDLRDVTAVYRLNDEETPALKG